MNLIFSDRTCRSPWDDLLATTTIASPWDVAAGNVKNITNIMDDFAKEPEDLKKSIMEEPEMPSITVAAPAKDVFTHITIPYTIPPIKRVIFSADATIVIFADDTKEVSRCGSGEPYDRYTGFMACVCKKLFGSTTAAKKLMNQKDPDRQAAIKQAKLEAAREKADKEAAEQRQHKHDKAVKKQLEKLLIEEEAYDLYEDIINKRREAERAAVSADIKRIEKAAADIKPAQQGRRP